MTVISSDESKEHGHHELDGWTWSIECTRDEAFFISDVLSELEAPPATAVSMDEVTPDTFRVTAYYLTEPNPNDITQSLELVGIETPLLDSGQIAPIYKTNWVALSQENLTPVEAGRFIIYGAHDRQNIKHRSRTTIEINAAEAFGTAHHGTTKGCLKAIDAYFRISNPVRILDLGTGTGVLAIACAKLAPNACITATDIDPVATRTARANSVLNAVGNQIKIITCPGFEDPELRQPAKYELIIANILTGPLKSMSQQFANRLKPGCTLILSGILNTQATSVRNTFRAQGFIDLGHTTDGEWTTITMQLFR